MRAVGRDSSKHPPYRTVAAAPIREVTMMEDELGGGISAPQSQPPAVVGYNGKEHSRQALRWAAAEATRRRLPLLVVFAANYPGMAADPLEPGALEGDEEVTARGVREALDTSPDLQVSGVTEVISPTRAMIDASASSALVVIGTRGHGRIAGALLGSVAFAVAARAECPVVVLGGEAARRPIGPRWPVVVGTDGSEPAAAVVAFAADWALADSAVLEVVACTGDHPLADADPLTTPVWRLSPPDIHLDARSARAARVRPERTSGRAIRRYWCSRGLVIGQHKVI